MSSLGNESTTSHVCHNMVQVSLCQRGGEFKYSSLMAQLEPSYDERKEKEKE